MVSSDKRPFDLDSAAIGWRLAQAGDEQDAAKWAYDHSDELLAEIEDLTKLAQSYLAECSEERVRAAKAEAEVERLRTDAGVYRSMLALLDEVYPNSVYANIGMLRELIADLARLRAERDEAEARADQWNAAANRQVVEIRRLRADYQANADAVVEQLRSRDEEIKRLRALTVDYHAEIERGKAFIEDMDRRMPEQATEDADGWINSYRIPVGPWHRLLGWARGGVPQL